MACVDSPTNRPEGQQISGQRLELKPDNREPAARLVSTSSNGTGKSPAISIAASHINNPFDCYLNSTVIILFRCVKIECDFN